MSDQPLPRLVPWLIRYLRSAAPLILVYAALLSGIETLWPGAGGSIQSWKMITTLAVDYQLFRLALLAPAAAWSSPWPGKHVIRFALVALLLMVLWIAPMVIIAFSLGLPTDNNYAAQKAVAYLAVLPLIVLVLTLFGSLLPDAVLGQPFSLRRALRAARQTWARVLGQLIAFYLVATLAVLALAFWVKTVLPIATMPGWASFLVLNGFTVLGTLLDALAIAILSRAWIQVWGRPET